MSQNVVNSYRYAVAGCSSYPDSLADTADGNVNSATITDAAGVPSGLGAKCVNFAGSQSVDIADNSAFDWTSGGSCTFWFQPHIIQDKRIVTKEGGSNNGWQVMSEGGAGIKKMKFRIKSGEDLTTITGTSDIETDGTWYFIAVVYDQSAGTMKLYVDGEEEVNGTTATINTNDAAVYLGSNSTPAAYYDGLMEEVGIFDYPISEATIDELYNGGDGAKVSELTTTCSGIIAYYSCQEFDGSGDLPNDAIPT